MRYTVSADSFLEIPITTGTIQNVSSTDIEVSNEEVVGSGLVLKAGEMVGFNNATVYVCARPVLEGGTGIISVVPFSIKGEGGGGTLPIATKNTLGGIKVGNGLQIDKNGVLSSTVTPDNSVVAWTAGTDYNAGQYVIYDNKMYECVTANDDDEFDEEKWQVVGGSENVSITDWVAGKKYKADELVIYNNTLYKCITANEDDEFTPAKWQVIGGVGTNIDDWQKNHEYEIGNLVIYDDKIYQCATEHKSGDTFDSEKWTEIGDAGNVQAWKSGTSYAVDDFAIYDNRLYKCKTANSDTTFDPDNWQDMGAIQHTVEAWESGKSYAVGDLVLKDNVIYKCKTANDDTTFDPDNWTVEIDNDKSVTPWVSGTDYAVGKYVVYDNKIWECKTANDDVVFDEEKWTEISAATGIVLEQWADNTSYKTNQLVEHDGYAYLCLIAHTSTADFDDDFDAKYWRRMPSYVMKGADSANDGEAGLVPQPKKTDVDKFLCADGTWKYAVAGVQAARVTLWEGTKTGNDSSNVLLLDNISNYDVLEIESCIAWNVDGTSKNGYISSFFEVNTILENPTAYISVSNFLSSAYNYSMDVTFPDNTYFKIQGFNKGESLVTADIIKITGIKYIQPDSYSTEEKLIGTWIDGKPLYRKVFTGTAPSSAGVNTNIFTDPLFTNVDMCYVKDGYIKRDAGSGDIDFYKINESMESSYGYSSRIFISCSESSIRGAVGQQFTSRPLVVIVEYTKN